MKLFKYALTIIALVSVLSITSYSEAKTGKDIFLNSKCNMCHSINSLKIESKMPNKYPDLSEVGKLDLKTADIKKFLMKEGDLNGKKHAIKFKGEAAELDTLVNWLQTLK
jgi:cbb3-type cytochrome oxidase cytochrome c subunit